MSPVCCDVSIANLHSKSKLFSKHCRMYLQGLIQLFSFSTLNSVKLAATMQFKQQHFESLFKFSERNYRNWAIVEKSDTRL